MVNKLILRVCVCVERSSNAKMEGNMKKETLGKLFLLAAALIWGSSFVVMKSAVDFITPFVLLFIRFTLSTLFMSCLFFKKIKMIKNAKNIVCTGTPVKIVKKDYGINEKLQIIKKAGLNETKPIVLIFGGSQGAQKINEAILTILKNKLNKDYQIMWATGPKQYDIIKEKLSDENVNINNIENAKIVPYIYNMEEIMNVSNLIVARSGAMTITEISNLGKPSILIPLPNVSGDHQLHNAKVLENIGAAKIILNDELNGNILNTQIEKIVLDKNLELQMSKKALKVSTHDVEDKIYKEVLKLVKK